MNYPQFRKELAALINRYSAENGSNTPDFLLAEYLTDCLDSFDRVVTAREKWYGRAPIPICPQPDFVGNVCRNPTKDINPTARAIP